MVMSWIRIRFGLTWNHSTEIVLLKNIIKLLIIISVICIIKIIGTIMHDAASLELELHRNVEKVHMLETTLISCLNGGIIGTSGNETIGCTGTLNFELLKPSK